MGRPEKHKESTFVKIADKVSYGMGTPGNIGFWIVAVLVWFMLFALNPALESSDFLPRWFTSNAFNFPLNTVTTLAELYIGFLVAAATNRSERDVKRTIERISSLESKAISIEKRLDKELVKNTKLTRESYALSKEIHRLTAEVHRNTRKS